MSVGERMAAASNRFYLRLRHPDAWKAEASRGDFDSLRGSKYALLHTFRKSGEAVPTPVWFGLDEAGKLYFRSEAHVGKIKRIRNDGRVLIGPCTFRGKPTGPLLEGRARLLSSEGEAHAEAALQSNYGLFRRAYEGVAMNIGPAGVYVEVVPV
jgi:PPOX class probable F420-dependent enzyme